MATHVLYAMVAGVEMGVQMAPKWVGCGTFTSPKLSDIGILVPIYTMDFIIFQLTAIY